MRGRVITKNAGLFWVECGQERYLLPPSGKAKENGVFVGDDVEFEGAINKVYPRKNLLIRPPMANIDKLFIVISPLPKPDLVLVDKMIVYCYLNDIIPILVINKMDIAQEEFLEDICNSYNFLKIIKVSAKTSDVEEIKDEICGITAFAGQSAVGKSSLINSLIKEDVTQVGGLSKKIDRGKQTTRIVSLYKFEGGYLADTAGFSMLDLSFVSNLKKEELSSYYPDFLHARGLCKYRSCLHKQGDCGVIKEVREGKISQTRYKNYLKILDELDKRGIILDKNKGRY